MALEFSTSGADWIAIYKGKIIAGTPMEYGEEKPPKWFKRMIKMYVNDIKKGKLKKII